MGLVAVAHRLGCDADPTGGGRPTLWSEAVPALAAPLAPGRHLRSRFDVEGLATTRDERGLTGRGLWFGRHP